MSIREVLSPLLLGAEVLVRVTQKRSTGRLEWSYLEHSVEIIFVSGRPQVMVDAGGKHCFDREELEKGLRLFGSASAGNYAFHPLELSAVAHFESLRVDTIGIVQAAMLDDFGATQLDAVWDARVRHEVRSTQYFDRISAPIRKVCSVHLERPMGTLVLSELLEGASRETQRAWITVMVLGALEVVNIPDPTSEVVVEGAEAVREEVSIELSPSELNRRRLITELVEVYQRAQGETHYELLGVSRTATAKELTSAYEERVALWSRERYQGVELGSSFRLLEDLSARINAAYEILSKDRERAAYNLFLERKAKGFAVDPNVILEAEELFQRAQVFVRRGDVPAAEPLLREAVGLNRGDAEFWAYLGFAIYGLKGKSGLGEALEALGHAEVEDAELDCIYEFQGRIACSEGDLKGAKTLLARALELNPDNSEAQRELQGVNAFIEEERARKGLKGALRGLFGRGR